jgi:hypothetical protein
MPPSVARVTTINWNNELAEQLDWHWRTQFRPRLEGLTRSAGGLIAPVSYAPAAVTIMSVTNPAARPSMTPQ